MQDILILKMGSTFPELVSQFGDFEDWVQQSIPESARGLVQISRKDKPFPDPKFLKGLIITGSHAMVTHATAWERKAMHWVRWALDEGVPTLGLCYGHQMLAQILGGSVNYLPDAPEAGYHRLQFMGDYEADPLFGLYPSHVEAFTFHYQTIHRLPDFAKTFARSTQDRNHAVRFGEWVWGVQYHPEFSSEVAAAYIRHEIAELERAGLDVPQLLRDTQMVRPPDPLIPRFIDLILSRE